jgi:SAM-dependent methyltransferase
MQAYDPQIFTRVRTVDQAKAIILTPERNLTTNQRWEAETPHVVDLISHHAPITAGTTVLDYGCGVGRIAKELRARSSCVVVGADISPNMRALAASYVDHPEFVALDPVLVPWLRIKADVVVAVWVLQHVADLPREINIIRNAMNANAVLFVVNELKNRFVPVRDGWLHDGVDVPAVLEGEFNKLAAGRLDPKIVGEHQSERTFWAAYSK